MKNSKGKFITGISLAALLFASTVSVNAQDAATEKKGEVGFRMMPTFSRFNMHTSNGGIVKGNVTIGYGFGAFLGVGISKHIGVQVELGYSAISQKYTDRNVERTVNLRYINIPLLLSINSNKTRQVNFNAVVGPQIGINVGSSLKASGYNETDTLSAVLSLKQGDLGIAYGFGVDFALNEAHTFRLGTGYRGSYGLIDISDNSKTKTTDSYYVLDKSHIMTNSFYLGISLLF